MYAIQNSNEITTWKSAAGGAYSIGMSRPRKLRFQNLPVLIPSAMNPEMVIMVSPIRRIESYAMVASLTFVTKSLL